MRFELMCTMFVTYHSVAIQQLRVPCRQGQLAARVSLVLYGAWLATLILLALVGFLKGEGPWFAAVPSTLLAGWLLVFAASLVCFTSAKVLHSCAYDASMA